MNSLLILAFILLGLMLLVAGKAGLRNFVGLVFNLILIFLLILFLSWGLPILPLLLILIPLILAVSIFMSSDESEITAVAFKASLITVFSLFLLIFLVQYLGNLQGFSVENAEELESLSLAIGVNFSNIAIAVMVVSMLGAVAEAAMAVTAALHELLEQNETISLEHFKQQKTIISQQIFGTALNTLFFGMLGGSLGLLLWFVRLNYTFSQIFNSKLLGAEIVSMLLGMLGILFVIILSAHFVEKEREKKKNG
jgi:uncharacterized membrane protein